jgi:hypothetical protein
METPNPPKRRRLPKAPSPVDLIMERNATEARRIAVLEFVGTQLAECNARLASVGVEMAALVPHHPATNGNGHVVPPPASPVAPTHMPCVWGDANPTRQYDVGGGRIQWLCRQHAAYVSASRKQEVGGIAASAVNSMKDSVEPTYNPIQQPITNLPKTIMHPIEEDVRASQQPANGALEQALEELPEDGENLES